MEDAEIVDRDAATAKLIMDAFKVFYEKHAEQARTNTSELAMVESRIMSRFDAAHKENRETAKENHECIEELIAGHDVRLAKLERWQTGLIYAGSATWAIFLTALGWIAWLLKGDR